jgi:competence protein ComEC
MASVPGPAGLALDEAPAGEPPWRAPLFCPALAVTAGVVLDSLLNLPLVLVALAGVVSFLVFAVMRWTGPHRLGLVYLHLGLVALGAGYHAYRCELFRDDDVALLVGREPRPVRLVGEVEEEPRRLPAPLVAEPLRSQARTASAATVLRAMYVIEGAGKRPVSGNVRLVVAGKEKQPAGELLADLHTGDEVEVAGRLARISGPGNPGEFDVARYWAEQGVHALLRTPPGGAGVRRVREGWRQSPRAWFALVRNRAHAELEREVDEQAQGLARALLLGEGAPMTNDDWARYVRTGVVHVLAISGQHLVVVALFLWWVLRRVGVRQRHGAILVGLILLSYALLTGGRPPALRAGIVALAACIALALRWPLLHANLFFLAWLVVLAVDPGSACDMGCQLSFLSVAVLACLAGRLFPAEADDPVDRLVDDARPAWLRWLRRRLWEVYQSFAICFLVWALITPLAAYHNGLVAPAGLLLGPPLTLLTSIALLLGFVLLALAALGLPAFLVSKPLGWCLLGCDWLVDLAERWPVHVYVGQVPLWWVIGFYAGLVLLMVRPHIRWRWPVAGALGWVCVLLVSGSAVRPEEGLRCTFVDVGHGGCAVLELPDGRVVLHDAGALGGPNVAERSIAPFLWQRRVQRIDLLVLSHADLDHFNAVAGLAERFAIGEVLLADNFELKNNEAVKHTVSVLSRRGVPIRHVSAGDRLSAAGVELDVLHPPAGWRGRTANEDSVVLLVRHGEGSILLTGDLEGAGMAKLLQQPRRSVDVLQAPHHGSNSALVDVEGLLRWCKPRLVVSSQAAPRSSGKSRYEGGPWVFWTTYERGAVTVRSGESGLIARGYRSGQLELPARLP